MPAHSTPAVPTPESAARSKADVFERLHRRGPEIRSLGVRRLSLFGSFARDESRPESDVDLLVDFEPGAKTYARFLDLADLLEATLHRRVELVTTEGLSPYMGPRILTEAERVPLDD